MGEVGSYIEIRGAYLITPSPPRQCSRTVLRGSTSGPALIVSIHSDRSAASVLTSVSQVLKSALSGSPSAFWVGEASQKWIFHSRGSAPNSCTVISYSQLCFKLPFETLAERLVYASGAYKPKPSDAVVSIRSLFFENQSPLLAGDHMLQLKTLGASSTRIGL